VTEPPPRPGVRVAGPAAGQAAQPDARTAELAGSLVALQDRISAACAAAGREPGAVTLVAVTKTFPAADIRRLAALGVTDVGENRD
jgi:PLP dependent protein